MNFSKIMASLVVLSATAACNNSATEEAPIIERPEVKVEDGKLTPELLFALGRVTDPQVSPDGSRILYGIGYESAEQNKSNRELWVMNTDGSAATRLTRTAASEQNAV